VGFVIGEDGNEGKVGMNREVFWFRWRILGFLTFFEGF